MIVFLLKLFHYLCMLFIILPPFLGNQILLKFYVIVMTCTLLHWIITNGNCALSDIEFKLTGKETVKNNINYITNACYLKYYHIYLIVIALILIAWKQINSTGQT